MFKLRFKPKNADPYRMEKEVANPLLQGKAYAIFVREIKSNLRYFDQIFSKPKIEQQEHSEAFRLSHTIKGGAGMFGLDQISRSASELEQVLRELNNIALTEREKITELVEQIKSAALEMPAPVFQLESNITKTEVKNLEVCSFDNNADSDNQKKS